MKKGDSQVSSQPHTKEATDTTSEQPTQQKNTWHESAVGKLGLAVIGGVIVTLIKTYVIDSWKKNCGTKAQLESLVSP